MALSRGVPPRPQAFVAQADAQPFAALLDAAVSPAPDHGAAAPAASAQPNQQKPPADTGTAAQDDAAASPSAPAAGNAANGSAAAQNGAPAQSASAGTAQDAASDGKPDAAPDVNGTAKIASGVPANGMPIQTADAHGAHQTTAKNTGDRTAGPTPNTNEPAITMPARLPGVDNNPNGSNGTTNGGPSADDPADPDASDAGRDASNDTAAAAVAAALVNASGAGPANGVTPDAAKPAADGKDDEKDQADGSADAATAAPASNQTQLPAADAPQPVAAAVVVNAAPDPASAANAKPGLAIADVVKTRAKLTLASAATAQTTRAQDDTTDGPGSSSALDPGGSNFSSASSGSDDSAVDVSAPNAQQAFDQPQVPGATGAALLNQIDFASLGGTEHFGLRGEAAGSVNNGAASGAPNGATNAAMAPNFGIFAPNTIATNIAAPAAAASEPAVPLAGLAVAIAARAQAGSSQFDIRLDPPELGRIDVRLDVDGDGQVRTHVTADRADTLQLLQSQQPQLERALEQAGLKTADNGLQFTLRDQSFAGQNGGAGGQQYANQPAPLVIPEIDTAPIDTTQIYARLRLGNGLDISV